MSGYEGIPGDTHIIHGIDALVNRDQVAAGLNLDEIERALVQETPVQQSREQLSQINRTIVELSREYGVNIEDVAPQSVISELQRSPPRYTPPATHRYSPAPAHAFTTPTVVNNMPPEEDDVGDAWPPTNSPGIGGRSFIPRSTNAPQMAQPTRTSAEAAAALEEQEDQKACMLADIEMLIQSLQVDGADLTRIVQPTQASSFKEVESVLRLLQMKVDRTRCATLAEEVIAFGAMALEEIFDGQNQWLGYSPDLTGFHNVTRVKLRRTRFETGQIAASVLKDNSIGPFWRLIMELFPAAVLQARTNSKRHGQPSMFDDASMSDTHSRIGRNG